MNNAIVSIPTDPVITKKAQEIAEKEGLDFELFFGTILNKLLKDFSEKESIGTDIHISLVEEPNKRLLDSMRKAKENREKGKASPIFRTVKEMNKWLDEQGV